MKFFKKIGWLSILFIFIAGLVYLMFFSDKTLATMDGNRVTEKEFIERTKQTPSGRKVFTDLAINKALTSKFGNDFEKKTVDDNFTIKKSIIGNDFQNMLAYNGQDTKEYKENLQNQLMVVQAIEDNTKYSNEDLESAFENYIPKMKISLASYREEDSAKKAIEKLDKGESFESIVESSETDVDTKKNKGELPEFDTTTIVFGRNAGSEIFQLNSGDYTKEPITTQESRFIVVKMNSKEDKKGNWENNKKALKKQIATETFQNQNKAEFIQKSIGKVLKEKNVNVSDKDLKTSLDSYIVK